MKQNTEALNEGIKQESLLARDFEFAFYKKVSTCSYYQTQAMNFLVAAKNPSPTNAIAHHL